jgi:flagellar hook-length control protein FliK
VNPASVALQSQRLLSFGPLRLDTPGDRADFADRLRSASTGERTSRADAQSAPQFHEETTTTQTDTTQAEPAPDEQTDQHAQENGAADQTSPEGQTSVSDSPIASAAHAAAKDRAGPVGGRPRDLRQRTDQEFFGHTDLAQLAAQELATTTPAAPHTEPSPPATPASEARGPQSTASAGQSPPDPTTTSGDAAPAEAPASKSQAAPAGQKPAHPQTSGATGEAGKAPDAQPEAAPTGTPPAAGTGTPEPVGSVAGQAVPTTPAPAAGDAAGAKPAAEASGREVTGVGGVRTNGQLLRRLERHGSPLTLARHTPETPEGPVPAAALRGLAAALRQGGGTVTLRLNPETLGSLKIQVSTQEAGIVAKLQASTEQARSLLTENVDMLRSAMESRGLSVDRIVIEHASGWTPSGSRDHDDARAGGAGRQDVEHAPPWNGGGSDPGLGADQDSGRRGPGAGFDGQGRPEGREQAPGGAGAGAQVAGAEALGASSSGVITDDLDPEQLIMLRVDAVA